MADVSEQKVKPIQQSIRRNEKSLLAEPIHMAAYEVYVHLYGEQKALITGWCRGGFSIGEVIAFLYARSFPKTEWRKRVEEAFNRNVNL